MWFLMVSPVELWGCCLRGRKRLRESSLSLNKLQQIAISDPAHDSGDILLIFEFNSQSNYTPFFHALEAMCWLSGIVYGFFPSLHSQGAHKEQTAGGPWGAIHWIWEKVNWIRIVDPTFNVKWCQKCIGKGGREREVTPSCPVLPCAVQ